MKIAGKIGLSILSIVLSLLFVEWGTRIIFDRDGMHYGIEMWKLAKQIKRKSPIPEVGHENTPNREAFLMGVKVSINSLGLRDYEYPIQKDSQAFRILVLGDSMTFGWGTALEETYPKVLERMLNENPPAPFQRYEVINAGVGNYNTVQEVAYFKERGLLLNPDMVLLGFYINDAEEVPKRSSGFFKEHFYFYVLLSTGWDALRRKLRLRMGYKDYYEDLYSDTSQGWKDCQAALKELIRLCQENRIELRIAIIPELHEPNENYAFLKIHKLISQIGSQHGIPVIDLLGAFKGMDASKLWVSPGDPHANGKACQIIAEEIYNRLWQSSR